MPKGTREMTGICTAEIEISNSVDNPEAEKLIAELATSEGISATTHNALLVAFTRICRMEQEGAEITATTLGEAMGYGTGTASKYMVALWRAGVVCGETFGNSYRVLTNSAGNRDALRRAKQEQQSQARARSRRADERIEQLQGELADARAELQELQGEVAPLQHLLPDLRQLVDQLGEQGAQYALVTALQTAQQLAPA